MPRCAVVGCSNNERNCKRRNVSFHRFPKENKLRKAWVHFCKRPGEFCIEYARICSDHFEESDYERDLKSELLKEKAKKILKPVSIPRIEIPTTTTTVDIGLGNEVKKRRWRSMKDSFFRSITDQEGKSGDAAKTKGPYLSHKQMSFLLKACQNRETSGNMQPTTSTSCAFTPVHNTQKCTRLPKKRKQDQFEREIVDVLKASLQRSPERTQDPDEMFLLSQLPKIKKLSLTKKMDFQIKFIQLLQSYTTDIQSTATPINSVNSRVNSHSTRATPLSDHTYIQIRSPSESSETYSMFDVDTILTM